MDLKQLISYIGLTKNFPTYKFSFTGFEQSVDLRPGIYSIECWGASGSNFLDQKLFKPGGNGSYTFGKIRIDSRRTFYIYAAQKGASFLSKPPFGGGGYSDFSGGGASDVRLTPGDLIDESFDSLKSRIMVAAGGGGADSSGASASGGGLNGFNTTAGSIGATQTAPGTGYSNGTFGKGGGIKDNSDGNGGGGGGYYGGGSGFVSYNYGGSGGSSFISGYEGCKAVKERSDVIDHTNTSYHYSGFIFTNTEMISGNETMPVPSSSTEEGIHSGEGAFRITILMYHYHCTYKRSLFPSLIPNLFIFIFSPINRS